MQSGLKIFFIPVLILLLFYSLSFGQNKLTTAQVDSIISKGKTEINNKEWGDAIDTFGDLLEDEPDNLTANYYYAIGQRETGNSRNPIERYLRFKSSEKHFKKIISIDSSFKDTFYQYALLKFYREDFFEAAELAEHQLEINRNSVSAAVGIFHVYDVMLVNESEDKVEEFLKSRNSPYDKYFLGEFYRRTDSLQKAKSIFISLLSEHSQLSLTPVYLSLVRLYVQQNKYEKAENTYWTALDSVSDEADKKLFQKDFDYILNARDYSILKKTLSLIEFKKVMRIFWIERNPLPSMPYHMRLIEHYQRMIYAEKNYRYNGVRLKIFDANKLDVITHPPWYNLNDKFNDRGVIYVRYGEPDEKSTTLGGDKPTNMSWLYYATKRHPRMIFYFKVDPYAPPGYWKLVPMFFDRDILNDLVTWDSRYFMVNRSDISSWDKLAREGVKTAERGLTTDVFRWPDKLKSFKASVTLNQFKENKNTNLLFLDYAVPLDELKTGMNESDSISLNVDVSIFDTSMNRVMRKDTSFKFTTKDVRIFKNLFIDGDKFILSRHEYWVSISIREPEENKLFGENFKYNLSDFDDSLSSSSLRQAFKISPNISGATNKDNLTIIPNPTESYVKSENVLTYYEIYNLSYNKNGRTDYSVSFNIQPRDTSKSVWDFFAGLFGSSGDYKISIQNNYTGTEKNVSNYLAFDISELKSGEYKLMLKIKDNVSGKVTSTSSDLTVK